MSWQTVKPKLIWYGVGLLTGSAFSVLLGAYHARELKRIEEQTLKYEQLYVKQNLDLQSKVTRLTEENKTLKSSTRIVEEVNADGSRKKIFENDTESQTEKRVAEYEVRIQQLQHQLETLTLQKQHKLTLSEKTRPSATFHLGLDTNLQPYGSATYNFSGPWILGGFGTQAGQFGFGLGVQF